MAIHAQNLGLDSAVISAIGRDELGQKLIDILQDRQVSTTFITTNEYPTGTVSVKDTVGAGDSFLAAMLFGISHLLEPQLALDYAAALGAMVASKEGANPVISKTELKAFIDASI